MQYVVDGKAIDNIVLALAGRGNRRCCLRLIVRRDGSLRRCRRWRQRGRWSSSRRRHGFRCRRDRREGGQRCLRLIVRREGSLCRCRRWWQRGHWRSWSCRWGGRWRRRRRYLSGSRVVSWNHSRRLWNLSERWGGREWRMRRRLRRWGGRRQWRWPRCLGGVLRGIIAK